MRRILSSYRWRRRLAWSGVSVALLAGIVVAAILLPKDSGRKYVIEPTGTEPAQTVDNNVRQIRVTREMRRALNETLVAFVRTGVTRADPSAAWDLATPQMRSTVNRKQWNGGELPVQPYPAAISNRPTWNLLSAYPGDVSVDLVLQPKAGSNRGPIAFAVELKQPRKGGRWLVDSMIPEQTFGPTPSAAPARTTTVANGQQPTGALSPLWFIVPGILLGLIALVPIGVLMNTWRRNRAIERRYRAERGL